MIEMSESIPTPKGYDMNCNECMYDAPFKHCCKCECGEHVFCRDCKAKSRGTNCPDKPKTLSHEVKQ